MRVTVFSSYTLPIFNLAGYMLCPIRVLCMIPEPANCKGNSVGPMNERLISISNFSPNGNRYNQSIMY